MVTQNILGENAKGTKVCLIMYGYRSYSIPSPPMCFPQNLQEKPTEKAGDFGELAILTETGLLCACFVSRTTGPHAC